MENSLKKNRIKIWTLGDELADVLWVVICLANQTGIDLTKALEKNFEKMNVRDRKRHQENKKLK
jgi:NTP pyrophosphatase (non-canonical NTP hydrolase)